MRVLKNHFGVIFPLIILLFSIEFSVMTSRIVSEYETSMSNEYNIIVVSKKELTNEVLKSKIASFKDSIKLDTKSVLDRLKNDISEKNLKDISFSLPNFYSIKLDIFPSPNFMSQIERDLLGIDGVLKVETFAKTHDKVYRILLIFKVVAQAFTFLIALLGITLIFKQMRIWLYEHRRRIEVMTDLGAPYWLKSAMLYKLALIDSIIATALVCALYIWMPYMLAGVLLSAGFAFPHLDIFKDTLTLFASSVVVSIISVSLVMIRSKAN